MRPRVVRGNRLVGPVRVPANATQQPAEATSRTSTSDASTELGISTEKAAILRALMKQWETTNLQCPDGFRSLTGPRSCLNQLLGSSYHRSSRGQRSRPPVRSAAAYPVPE